MKQKMEQKLAEFENASLSALAEMRDKAGKYIELEDPRKALKKLQGKNWELP